MSTLLGCSGFCYCDLASAWLSQIPGRCPETLSSFTSCTTMVCILTATGGRVCDQHHELYLFLTCCPKKTALTGDTWLPDLLMWTIASMLTTALKREFWHLILLYPI